MTANPLLTALGATPSDKALAQSLLHVPARPRLGPDASTVDRLVAAQCSRELFIPSRDALSVAQTLEVMLRHGYERRHPASAVTWSRIMRSDGSIGHDAHTPPMSGALYSLSGTGKSRTIARTLARYPAVLRHMSFPQMANGMQQLVYLRVEVPADGKAQSFVQALLRATDAALEQKRFADWLQNRRWSISPSTVLAMWAQYVSAHFLGILVIDEVQNLFKMATVATRKSVSERKSIPRVVDGETLKLILELTNDADFPVFLSGTDDARAAIDTRLSNNQRLSTAGIHRIERILNPETPHYRDGLFPALASLHVLPKAPAELDQIAKSLHELSAGIPRLITGLWCAAQRCALERDATQLASRDVVAASKRYLLPLQTAIQAIRDGDLRVMIDYADIGWQ